MPKNLEIYFAIERSIRTAEMSGMAKSIAALVQDLYDRISSEEYTSLYAGENSCLLDSVKEAMDSLVDDACALESALSVLSNLVAYGTKRNEDRQPPQQ